MLGEIIADSAAAVERLRWLVQEMERRDRAQVSKPVLVVAVDEFSRSATNGRQHSRSHVDTFEPTGSRGGHSSSCLYTEAHGGSDRWGYEGQFSGATGRRGGEP